MIRDKGSFRTLSLVFLLLPALLFPLPGWGAPPGKILTRTLEGARIIVREADQQPGAGDLSARPCNQCPSVSLAYNPETVFIDGLGRQRPVKELRNWNGSTALVRYRLADDAVELVEIRR